MHETGMPAAVGSASSATCAIKLDLFEGPLDLLLHLIRENEMDITDLPMSEIANQYIAFLDVMQELQLDVAAEYLVIAATLTWIKSRLLLPPSEDDDEDEGLDPRAELVARLLEYERFKEAAGQLGEYTREGRDVFRAHAPEPAMPDAEREIEVSLLALLDAFRKVLARVPVGPGLHEVEADSVTVYARMRSIMEQIGSYDGSLEFEQLFESADGEPPSRALIVATFLALLELVRVAALRVYQGAREADGVPDGPIRLRRSDEGAEEWRRRIAEDPRAVEGL